MQIALQCPPDRFVIVHYHLFKNGGTTLESILEREFPGRFASFHGYGADCVLDGEHLAQLLNNTPEIAAITSHHLRFPLPEIRGIVLFDLCFIRHPLLRLQSMYSYLRKIDDPSPLSDLAMRSPSEFFRHLIDHSPHLVSNVQVLQLARAGRFTRPAGEQDLVRAQDIVRDMSVPGLVELFDESLVCAEYFLQPAFPGIRMEYILRNASQPYKPGTPGDSERLSALWGNSVYEDLARLNQFDMDLYITTRNEIQRRFALVPNAQNRLLEFRSRCSDFQTMTAAAT
jgi:hypothetical protein